MVRRRPTSNSSGGAGVTSKLLSRRFASAMPFVAAVTLATPLVVLAMEALSTRWFYPDPIPVSLTTAHFTRVLSDPATWRSIRAGLGVSGVVTALVLVLAWPASQVLARPHLRGRTVVVALLFLPSLLPAVGLAMGIDVVLLRLGVAGTYTAVVVAHLAPTIPYGVVALTAAFVRHDRRIEAQAAVLGASPWQRLRLVTLPSLRGGLTVAAALVFVVSWSQYLLTVLAGSGRIVTVTMLLFAALSGGSPSTVGVLALTAAVPATIMLSLAGSKATAGALR